jgi:hypothetical protein
MASQTLPRTHRCDATIGHDAAAFGFVPVACQQVVGTRTYVTTSGLRVSYCAIEGHEANVRRRFGERPEMPDESEAERYAEMWQRMNPS